MGLEVILNASELENNGSKEGLKTLYYENGTKKEEIPWNKGKLDGMWRSWFQNGKNESQYRFVNGIKHGKWQWWFEDGKLREELNWNNGKRHGSFIEYYKNGRLKSHLNYQDDVLHGACTFWYKNGNKEQEIHYFKGQEHGESITWYESGQKESKAYYVKGKPYKSYIEWDENGKVLTQLVIKDNEVKKGEEQPQDSIHPCRKIQKIAEKDVTFNFEFPPISLPPKIELGKPILSNLRKTDDLLFFFSNTFLNQYELVFNKNRFIITSKPGTEGEPECINDIVIKNANIRTPEGISIGDPLKFVLMIPGVKVEVMEGFGYWVALPSGWNAVFYQSNETSNQKLLKNSKVKEIAKSLSF
jgi:antitoxin component YwqK of YwqJK toxin-antitoxin module